MNNEDKIHINSFKFYDRDELEELTKQYYLENQELNEKINILIDNVAEYEDECNKYKKIIDKIYEIINYEKDFYDTKEELVSDLERLLKNETQQIAKYELIEDTERLHKENQELKKQLENCYCNRTDCSSRIRNSKQYDSLVQKTEKQQKKFIEYLEGYIATLENQKESVEGLDIAEEHILMTLEENLAKYKEIIGDKE